jgi:hypothetical protein
MRFLVSCNGQGVEFGLLDQAQAAALELAALRAHDEDSPEPAAFNQAIRSANPASARFCQHTSWKALPRQFVLMPSICTRIKPSSAKPC